MSLLGQFKSLLTKYTSSGDVDVLNKVKSLIELTQSTHFSLQDITSITTTLTDVFTNPDTNWEVLIVCISLISTTLRIYKPLIDNCSEQFLLLVQLLLEAKEPRVRMEAATIIPLIVNNISINNMSGLNSLYSFATLVIAMTVKNFDRVETTRVALLGDERNILLDDTTGWHNLESYLKALHTLVVAFVSLEDTRLCNILRSEVVSYRDAVLPLSDLVITRASTHLSRHVREMTYNFLYSWLSASMPPEDCCGGVVNTDVMPGTASAMGQNKHSNSNSSSSGGNSAVSTVSAIYKSSPSYYLNWSAGDGDGDGLNDNNGNHNRVFCDQISEALRIGLQDNWSQIRLAAGRALRVFLLAMQETDKQLQISGGGISLLSGLWPTLLPRLCMNRYYAAEAVKRLSQDTWRDIMGARGKDMLTAHLSSAVGYYSEMCGSGNHMVVEAACHSLGEVLVKITDRDLVSPHIPLIRATLLKCLRDTRWPVRDAACLATGKLLRWYPEETRSELDELLALWQVNLRDCIWSVRENASLAYAEAMQSSNGEVREKVLRNCVAYVCANILKALGDAITSDKTKPNMKNFSFLPQSMLDAHNKTVSTIIDSDNNDGGTLFGTGDGTVVDTKNLSDTAAVPPKAALTKGWGCCVDCVELRAACCWEVTHGAVYLLKSLCALHPTDILSKRSRQLIGNTLSVTVEAESSSPTSSAHSGSSTPTSLLDALFVLLSTDSLNFSEQLHSAIYEEVPFIVIELCKQSEIHSAAATSSTTGITEQLQSEKVWRGLDLGPLLTALTRDLQSTESNSTSGSGGATAGVAVGVVSDGDRNNRNFSKYKVNRVAAAAVKGAAINSVSSSSGNNNSTGTNITSTNSSSSVSRQSKSARRVMAEKCLEALVDCSGIPAPVLLDMFAPGPVRDAATGVIGHHAAQAAHIAAESAKCPSFNSYFTD